MTWYYSAYFVSTVVTAAVMGVIAWYSWRHKEVAGAGAYLWIASMVSLLALFEGISMIGPSKEWALIWFKLRYFPLAMIPPLWLIFTLFYAGRGDLLTKPRIAAFFIEPLITQAMVWTGGFHGFWVLHNAEFYSKGLFYIAETSSRIPGPWFFVHLLYSYTLMIAGMVILFIVAVRMRGRSRGQAVAVIIGTAIMIIGSLIPMLKLFPEIEINPIIPVFLVGSIIIAWGVYRFKFLSIKPFISEERGLPLRLAMVYLFLVLGIMSAGYLYDRFFEQKFKVGVERQLLSIADLKVNELVHFRRERVEDAEMLFRNPSFNALVAHFFADPADAAVARQVWTWIDSVRSSHRFIRALLIGTDGTPRMSSPYPGGPVSDDIEQESRNVARSGRIVFFDFYRTSREQPIRLAVMIPLTGASGPMGVLALIIDPSVYLYPIIQRWPVPTRTAETLLVRREGGYALFLNELRFSQDSALRLRLPLTSKNDPAVMAVTGREGIAEGVDYRGESVIAALRAVPDSPWFLVSLINRSEAFEPVRERVWLMMALVAVLLAGSGAGIGLIWRWQGERFYRERYAAAEALRESEERLRVLFEYSLVGKSLTAPDGKLLQANEAFANMLGYSIEELHKIKFSELTHPADLEESRECIRCLMANEQESYRMEKRFFHKNGRIVWTDVSSRLMRDANGEPKYFITSMVDITGRKRAEEDRERLARQRQMALDAAKLGWWHYDPATRVSIWDERYGEIFGVQGSMRDNDEILKLLHPDDLPSVWAAVEAALNPDDPKAYSIRYRVNRPDGVQVWVEAHGMAEFEGEGEARRAISFVGTVADITDRKIEDDMLRESENRFRALFEYSMVGKSLTAPDGKLLQVNRAFADMLGYTIEELRNVNFTDITHPDDVEKSMEGLHRLLANEQEFYRMEKRYFRKNGGVVWADVSIRLLNDANGEPKYFVTSIVNITERRLAEEALKRSEGEMKLLNDVLEQRVRERTASLEESNREMETFTYSVSHDLRAPLRAVAGYSAILLEDHAGTLGDEVKRILMTIKDRIERMGRLIDDLLAFSRLGRQELKKTEIDMNLLVKSVFDELMGIETGRNVDLELLTLPPARGDQSLIREVVVNLLSNAIKFTVTREKASIRVWAEEDGRNTAYYVQDNGVGYDMSYSNKLFGVFERLHGMEEFGGTGVGLAIVQRIIKRHGGQVHAEGRVNEGATFSFSIPKDGEKGVDREVAV